MLSWQVNSSNLCNGIYTQTQYCKGHYYEITFWIRTISFILFKEKKNELENSAIFSKLLHIHVFLFSNTDKTYIRLACTRTWHTIGNKNWLPFASRLVHPPFPRIFGGFLCYMFRFIYLRSVFCPNLTCVSR